jgi:hypothetical protein
VARSTPPAADRPPDPRPGSAAAQAAATARPNWPGAVPRPTSPEFERSAKAWLFELAPGRWWHEEIFHRDPAELAHMVRLRLEATVAAMQAGLLSGPSPSRFYARPGPLEQKLELYARERDWARAMLEQVRLVEDGLRAFYARTAQRSPQKSALRAAQAATVRPAASRPVPTARTRPAIS